MATLVPPDPAVALPDALVAVSLDASADDAELLLSVFFSSDEQPDSPAMTIATPPTATTKPRFTTVLLYVWRDPSRSADHPQQYGARYPPRHPIGEKRTRRGPLARPSVPSVQAANRTL